MLGIDIKAEHITAPYQIFTSHHNVKHGHTILENQAQYACCFQTSVDLPPALPLQWKVTQEGKTQISLVEEEGHY